MDRAPGFSELGDLGVRAGFVWKKDNDGWQQVNSLRPLDAFNVPVTIIDPGVSTYARWIDAVVSAAAN